MGFKRHREEASFREPHGGATDRGVMMRTLAGRDGDGFRQIVALIALLLTSTAFLARSSDNSIEGTPSILSASWILITEIRDSPDGSEQVELHNQNYYSINMNGWELVLDGTIVSLTPLGNFPARAHRTIGEPASSNLRVTISLGDEGGIVELLDPSDILMDSVGYGQLGVAPDPLSSESVSRVYLANAYTNSWTRSSSPTFGSYNNVNPPVGKPNLVFNEVLFNALNSNDRFIEIYYGGLSTFVFTGFRIVGDFVYTLPTLTLGSSDPFHAIRATDSPGLFQVMGASGDNLYLYDSSGSLYDQVGWSSLHTQDTSMVRIPDGNGTHDGYNDTSSITAGWKFDQIPTLPLVSISPRQIKVGHLGETVEYDLTVKNKDAVSAIVNVEPQLGPLGWTMGLFKADGTTPLTDSPSDADTIPDVGILISGGSATIKAKVSIPPDPQPDDREIGGARASVSAAPWVGAIVALVTTIHPYIETFSNVSPDTIWLESSPTGFDPKEARVTLEMRGRGMPEFSSKPQDTMLLIDSSGSMAQNDPYELRLSAAKHYVDLLAVPDRAAVVDFDNDAILVGNDHLGSDYDHIKSNIDTVDSMGATNLYDPIRIANNEIIAYGDSSHTLVEILLTDGDDTTGHSDAQILGEAARARTNNIVIFTIGLIGIGSVNEYLLMDIANATGGLYMRATSASDLDTIYMEISRLVKKSSIAGYDDDVSDSIPMVSTFLPDYVHFILGSADPPVDYVGDFFGMTNLQWNVSDLEINETWTASFNVTSSLDGIGLRSTAYPDTKVSYIRHDGLRVNTAFPETIIDVLAPPVKKCRICGHKWSDANRDGVRNGTEAHIEGFRIELYRNGSLLNWTLTNSTGGYCFEDLDEGNYTVVELMPPNPDSSHNWVQTFPRDGGSWTITAKSGNDSLDVDFGNVLEFTESRTWGYWKTHTGFNSPPRDAAYDLLPAIPMTVDLMTPDGDFDIKSDAEALWLFSGSGTGQSPNCSGECRSLFRAQLMALHMSMLKFDGMASAVYIYTGDPYSGMTVQEIHDAAVAMLTDGSPHSFTLFQMTIDRINNNHNRGPGHHVLVVAIPPPPEY